MVLAAFAPVDVAPVADAAAAAAVAMLPYWRVRGIVAQPVLKTLGAAAVVAAAAGVGRPSTSPLAAASLNPDL